jgi:hypothetical protein
MGFLFLVAWAGGGVLLGLPAVALAIVYGARSGRRVAFWIPAALLAAAAAAARVRWCLTPGIAEGSVSVWPTMYGLVVGKPLIATLPLAAAGLLALRLRPSRGRDLFLGACAGLAASVPLQLVLPAFFGTLLDLLGLRAAY